MWIQVKAKALCDWGAQSKKQLRLYTNTNTTKYPTLAKAFTYFIPILNIHIA